MFYAIIAAISLAASTIMDKIVLSYQRIGHRQFIILLFLFLFILTAIIYPFWGHIDRLAFDFHYLFLLFLVIIIASIYNVLFYHAIEKEKVSEIELIVMLTPLSTIIIASIFLQVERNWNVFLAGIIASSALIFSHLRRYHLTFDAFQRGLLIYLMLYGFEAVLVKNLLFLYSPVALYLVRTLGVLVVLSIWFLFIAPRLVDEPKVSFTKINKKNYISVFLIAFLGVISMVLTYYSYAYFGVIFTTTILTLWPILTYLGSMFILKEHIKKRIILAAAIILCSIIYVNIMMSK
ncbi:MAG: DMT family transporter [Candidatus Berkelbacteria bacterium]|nr:DMT family transporter [Candidatus Berkelbacteria bacterium]